MATTTGSSDRVFGGDDFGTGRDAPKARSLRTRPKIIGNRDCTARRHDLRTGNTDRVARGPGSATGNPATSALHGRSPHSAQGAHIRGSPLDKQLNGREAARLGGDERSRLPDMHAS